MAVTALALSGCAASSRFGGWEQRPRFPESSVGVSASPRVAWGNSPLPKGGGIYKVGTPYQVAGRWYVPRSDHNYDAVGLASWYGDDFHGRYTSNGEIYDMNALTAAHPTLPMPSYAYVTNLENNRIILLRINDRGPYVGDRVIDLSRASARALGIERLGLAHVRVRFAGPAPLDGNDVRERRYLAGQPWAGSSRFAENQTVPRYEFGRSYAQNVWSAPTYRAGLAGR